MRFRSLWIFIKLLTLCSVVAGAACRKRSGSNCAGGDGLRSNEWSGTSLAANQLSLTFDDVTGDSAEDIARYLQTVNAPSVFFTSGAAANDKTNILSTISRAGHLVGSLGWSGQDLSSAPDPVSDVRRADVLIQSYASGNVFLIRSSGGWNSSVSDALKSGGLAKYAGGIGMDVGWKVKDFNDDMSCQQAGKPVNECVAGYLAQIQKVQHGIVDFRSTTNYTLSVLRSLIPQLQSMAYTFVRVDSIPDIKAKLVSGASQSGQTGGATCDDYK